MCKFLYPFIGFAVFFLVFRLQRKCCFDPIQTRIVENKCENYIKQACKMPSVNHIVGGRPAKPKEFPHMALIGAGEVAGMKWLCGGSLISENFVLSAAHCNSTPMGDAKLIRLGELDYEITKEDATPMDFLILEKIVHPEYKPPALYNDIALFRFEGLKKFTAYIRPICLNFLDKLPDLTPSASGWGTTSDEGPVSGMLMTVDLKLYNMTPCNEKLTGRMIPNGFNDTIMICAGEMSGGKDTCQGDSGGPLQFAKNITGCTPNIYSQIGIVSFGLGCGEVNTPGAYTRISHYIPWIEKIIWSN